MLDFRIKTFIAVCKYMNYTKASEKLNLTQPCVSQHIHYLEDYYGVKLFTYDNKRLQLTKAGKQIYNAMLSFHHDELRLKENAQLAEQAPKRLRFGATLSIGGYYLPQKLIHFLEGNPNLQIDLTVMDTKDLLARLNSGEIDFALVEGYFPKTEYEHMLIKREDLVAVRGANYPMKAIHTIEELFSYHLFVREQGSGTREVLARYLRENGYSLEHFTQVSTINDLHLIVQIVEHNLGISFLYRSVVQDEIEKGLLVPIEIPFYHVFHEFNFIWGKGSIFSASFRKLCHKLLDGSPSTKA